jgi:hypothetical protein
LMLFVFKYSRCVGLYSIGHATVLLTEYEYVGPGLSLMAFVLKHSLSQLIQFEFSKVNIVDFYIIRKINVVDLYMYM